ncbi:nucleotide exchange factor GrpE [Phenylobacterium sp. J367]|uniref:nucleotide exchange factor GrpE n=1 Tax=Phenylobacterium sp. J367 TaxID=2898435 RepID=UPI0021510CEC|nr:nucleotide exchange factor GrpE [Phenylobacterium sp. J367]MCR5878048.1 nucleotide exchange factor GrpE [Phenylobacterium sp. J367]
MSEDNKPADENAAFDFADGDAAELAALKAEAAGLREQVLRYAADMENTRRRVEREANDARAYAIQKFAGDLLKVADYLAMATNHAPADQSDSVVKNFVVGVQMTEKELLGAFERNGLKQIAPKPGDKFDPHKHQAVSEGPAEGGVAPGAVLTLMQPGYELLGRLVRPATVVVAAKGAAAGPAPSGGAYAAGEDPAQGGGAVDTRA